MTLTASTVTTPAGPLSLVARDEVLVAAGFAPVVDLLARLRADDARHTRDLGALSRGIRDYLAGDVGAIDDLPVDQPGGTFRQAAWKAMRAVPAGETISYAELAARAGSPAAVRAAGSACAGNLVALVVPCHRIVRTDGGRGGYYYGTSVKDWLLAHEGRHAARP